MTEKQELRFNKLCYKLGIYTPNMEEDSQSNGYKKLKKLIESGVPAATPSEYKLWKNNPTKEQLNSIPELKYLNYLHPKLAEIVRLEWESIIQFINS